MGYSGKNLDHLGLIAGMVDELGIVNVIDDAISQDHEKRYLSWTNDQSAYYKRVGVYRTPDVFDTAVFCH
jgi:hypothetical protein